MAIYKPGRELSPKTKSAATLILGFSDSRTKFLLFNKLPSLQYFAIAG